MPSSCSKAAFMEGWASPERCCLACGVYVCVYMCVCVCVCTLIWAHTGIHTHATHQVLCRMCALFGWQSSLSKMLFGTSMEVQWLRIHLPMQGTPVRALVQEHLACRRAAKAMHHNYWACTLEPTSHNYWARAPQLLKPVCLEPMLHNKRRHCNEKPAHRKEE